MIDSRLGKEEEREFEKLWDGPIYLNSFSSNHRGLVVLFKDSLPAKKIKFENILKGDYSRLTFVVNSVKILIKCCYAPNKDMTNSETDNYSNTFFKSVFDDSLDSEYDVTMMVGDFNVAPDHNMDTMGYLHENYISTRRFIDRMKSLNMLTDAFRHKHPDL